jgi:hypothetical protein
MEAGTLAEGTGSGNLAEPPTVTIGGSGGGGHLRRMIAGATLLVLLGGALVLYATRFPTYTDPNAPSRLSLELESLPQDTAFAEWHRRLATYETPRKRLSDLGRGVAAAGAGLLCAAALWAIYHRFGWLRTTRGMLAVWVGLWLMRLPLIVWYYGLRMHRFDFPTWGDAIIISIFEEWCYVIVGAVVASGVLAALLFRRRLPDRIRLAAPRSTVDWVRAVVVGVWLVALAELVRVGVPDGDEGMVFACIAASVPVLAFGSAVPRLRA